MLALEILEARLAAGDEAAATVNEVVEAAFGGACADIGRVGTAILCSIDGDGTRPATAPGG